MPNADINFGHKIKMFYGTIETWSFRSKGASSDEIIRENLFLHFPYLGAMNRCDMYEDEEQRKIYAVGITLLRFTVAVLLQPHAFRMYSSLRQLSWKIIMA